MKPSLVACGVALAGLLLLAVAGPAYRIGMPLSVAFTLMRWAAYVGLAAAGLSVGSGLWARRTGHRSGLALAAAGVAIGLTAAAIPYGWYREAQQTPPIHDLTTDLENPPSFHAVIPLRADAPNALDRAPEVAQLQRQWYPDLAPLTLPEPAGLVFDRATGVATSLGWEIVDTDRTAGRIEATDTSRWFGFKDDVVVRLTPWGTGTRVDVRSVSRVGLGDVGSNARRIDRFLAALRQP